VTVREVLDRAAETVGEELQGQPAVEARLRQVVGQTYRELGLYDEAEPQLKAALELQRRRLPPHNVQLLTTLGSLGVLYAHEGRYDEAEAAFREVLAAPASGGGGAEFRLALCNGLSHLYARQNRTQEAESVCVKGLEAALPTLGEENNEVRKARNNLAFLLAGRGLHAEARDIFAALLESDSRLFGEDHPDVLQRMNNLAFVESKLGNMAAAERLYLDVLQRKVRLLGEDHPDVLTTRNNLAAFWIREGKYADAEPHVAAVLAGARKVLPDDQAFLGVAVAWQGECLRGLGRYSEAEPALLEGYRLLAESAGPDNSKTVRAAGFLAALYSDTGDTAKAEQWRARSQAEE
jgi:tetratricopeptide (TPR) repeat protein